MDFGVGSFSVTKSPTPKPRRRRYLLASFTDGTTAVVDLREKADNVIASFSFLPVASQPICGTVLPGDKYAYYYYSRVIFLPEQ